MQYVIIWGGASQPVSHKFYARFVSSHLYYVRGSDLLRVQTNIEKSSVRSKKNCNSLPDELQVPQSMVELKKRFMRALLAKYLNLFDDKLRALEGNKLKSCNYFVKSK